ncbi:MAG: hypothetical protein Q9163_004240 [Psora crenata]
MAEAQALQLAPTASVKKHLPVRKISARYTTKPPAGFPEFELIKPSSNSVGMVVAVTEARPSTSESSEQRATPAEDVSRRRPRRPTLTIPTTAHGLEQQRPPTPPMLPPPPQRDSLEDHAPLPVEIPLPCSSSNTPTLVRSDGRATTAVEKTPVMRSMFPSYNPSVPLAQQHYYPSRQVAPALTRMRELAGSAAHATQLQQEGGDTGLAPAKQEEGPKESPLKRSESLKRPITFSKPEDLAKLWSIANGQATEGAADLFTLELSCEDLTLDSEIITFCSSTGAPLYALSASANHDVSITRIHPQDHRTKVPICASTIAQPTRQDPLITLIFPKLAGLMAIDESSSSAVARKLDRQASQLLQAEAIAQAQEREGTLLLWDSDSGRFCLMHPTLLDKTATIMRIEITPSNNSPERIIVFAPETEMPLLSLSMQTLALTLYTPAITALPSLYVLDTLMTGLLTLLLHIHRCCADPSVRHTAQQQTDDTESTLYFPPPPPSLHSNASKRDLRKQKSQSRQAAFRSPRSVKSTRSLRSTYDADRDVELGSLDPVTGRGAPNAVGGKAKQKPPKGLFAVDDPSLPRGTRAVLKFLYWIFNAIYWVLGAIVQIFVVIVVGVGKFITKL